MRIFKQKSFKCQICRLRDVEKFLDQEDIDFYTGTRDLELSIWVCKKCPYITWVCREFFDREINGKLRGLING